MTETTQIEKLVTSIVEKFSEEEGLSFEEIEQRLIETLKLVSGVKTYRVPTWQAAKELGVAQQAVRERMRRGIWDLGDVIPPEDNEGQNYSFHIYRPKLDRKLGKGGD